METASAVTAFSIKFLKLAKLASQKVNLPNQKRLQFNRLFNLGLKEVHALNEQVLHEGIIGGVAKVSFATFKGLGKLAVGAAKVSVPVGKAIGKGAITAVKGTSKVVGNAAIGVAKFGGEVATKVAVAIGAEIGKFAAKIFIVLAAITAILVGTYYAILSLGASLKNSSASFFDSLFKTDSGKVILEKIETAKSKTNDITISMVNNAEKAKEQIPGLIKTVSDTTIETTSKAQETMKTSVDSAVDLYHAAINKLGGWYDIAAKYTAMGYTEVVRSLKEYDYTAAALYIAIIAGSIIAISLFAKWLYNRIKRVAISKALTTDNIEEVPALSAKQHSEAQKEDGEIRKSAVKEIRRLKSKVAVV